MEKLVDQGLVRSIGISNFSVKKIKVASGPLKLRKALLALQVLHAHTHPGLLPSAEIYSLVSCESVLCHR